MDSTNVAMARPPFFAGATRPYDLSDKFHLSFSREILPCSRYQEFPDVNWSGRGRDAEYAIDEAIPVENVSSLGHSGVAVVDRVTCANMNLARKRIKCSQMAPLASIWNEVRLLRLLRHPDIVQIVGTYKKEEKDGYMKFGIMLYPVAECDLLVYLEHTSFVMKQHGPWTAAAQACEEAKKMPSSAVSADPSNFSTPTRSNTRTSNRGTSWWMVSPYTWPILESRMISWT